MALTIVFLAFCVMIFLLVKVIRKDRARREGGALKEEQFLAAMRANPRGSPAVETGDKALIVPLPLVSTQVRPLAQPTAQRVSAPVTPIDLSVRLAAEEAPIVDITPAIGLPVMPLPPGPQPSAPLASPRDGHCLVCQESVDVRSNDQSRWGVKVQEPGTDRLAWIHLQCLAARLGEIQSLRDTLVALVGALDGALKGQTRDGQAGGGAQSLKQALDKAHQVLGSAPPG